MEGGKEGKKERRKEGRKEGRRKGNEIIIMLNNCVIKHYLFKIIFQYIILLHLKNSRFLVSLRHV